MGRASRSKPFAEGGMGTEIGLIIPSFGMAAKVENSWAALSTSHLQA